MSMHISPSINMSSDRATTVFPQMSPIARSLPPATQSDIHEILQREQDRAVALLSSSPLLASLFVSYANQAAAFESSTPSTESEEWKALENTISRLQEEIDKLKPEKHAMTERLAVSAASLGAFRSQVASLNKVNAAQQHDIDSLRAELLESKGKYNRLVEDSNTERDVLRSLVSDLEVRQADLKETIVKQQLKLSKFDRQSFHSPSNPPVTPTIVDAADGRKPDDSTAQVSTNEIGGKAKKKKKATPSNTPSTWGSWNSNSIGKKDESSGLSPVITSSVPGDSFGKEVSSGGSAEEVELHTPLTKKGKNRINTPSHLSIVTMSSETVDVDKRDVIEHLNEEQGLSRSEPVHPASASEVMPETSYNSTSELLKTPRHIKEEILITPKPSPSPPLVPAQPQISTPNPTPTSAMTEPEKPRKKSKATAQPTPASSLLGNGDAKNSSRMWGGTSSDRNTETIGVPSITRTGDRQSISTDTIRDQKRENQRENLVEGFLGSDGRKKNLPQSQMTTKSAPGPAPALAQKSSGWEPWGTILNNLAQVVNIPDKSPSPELSPVKPNIEDPPRGFTPSQPPKSQPAGFGPTPSTQKTSAGPAWGAKPVGGEFGPRTTTWGNATNSGINKKNLRVNTATRPQENGQNTAGPENIPESAVEIKHVPAPAAFYNSTEGEKEGAEEIQDDAREY